MKPLAAVIDTNVVIAGLLAGDVNSPTARILDGMLRGNFPFLLSTALLTEYREVLLRKKVRSLHGLSEDEIDALLTEIAANAIVREPAHRRGAPDKNDAHVWSLLESGKNCVLVTGDKLLPSTPKSHIATPRQFVESLPTWFVPARSRP
jgi:putative PIN family toxin of toxin-antitoxin system